MLLSSTLHVRWLMRCEWLRRYTSLGGNSKGEKSSTMYAFPLGPLEIVLIVVAVILVFGVGKLSQVGGALGKSVREFRREKGDREEVPLLTAGQPREDASNQSDGRSNIT